jgi:DnaJ-class molecular chaperone
VKTLDGKKVTVKIPPGTMSGKRFRVPGMGIERDGRHGDLIVEVQVTVPDKLTPEQEEAMKKFAETMDYKA